VERKNKSKRLKYGSKLERIKYVGKWKGKALRQVKVESWSVSQMSGKAKGRCQISDVRKKLRAKNKQKTKGQLLATLNCTASPDALFFTVWDKVKPL